MDTQPWLSQSRHLALLTFALVGLQFMWSVEMTYFMPFLLELGLAKSQAALVWLAPPLSGMIVQPVVGTLSDASTSPWGRRRPFLVPATLTATLCLLTLGWASDLCRLVSSNDQVASNATVALAVLCIYALDFAINIVQSTARSLIVDTLLPHQQQLGSAWAGRMLGFGTLLGYLLGTINLQVIFGDALGSTQFKRISVITSVLLLFCVSVTSIYVKERALPAKSPGAVKEGILKTVKNIVATMFNLPRKMQGLCWVTFWTWIGWSPFHVYGTTWVGEIYFRQNAKTAEELRNSTDVVGDIGRKGSFALLLFSLASFAGSIVLPWLVALPENQTVTSSRLRPRSIRTVASRLCAPRVDICTAWAMSELIFTGSMILTPAVSSYWMASMMVALCGIPWAMYGWAPLAILGEEVSRLGVSKEDEHATSLLAQTSLGEHEEDVTASERSALHFIRESTHLTPCTTDPMTIPPSAGVYLGVWNIYATIPQFVSTFIAMVAFLILEPGGGIQGTGPPAGGGPDVVDSNQRQLSGTAACLAIGAVCSCVAAVLTLRLRKL